MKYAFGWFALFLAVSIVLITGGPYWAAAGFGVTSYFAVVGEP